MMKLDELLTTASAHAQVALRGCWFCGGPLTHDTVDNGVGMQQCGPDGCDTCQWVAPEYGEPMPEQTPMRLAALDVAPLVSAARALSAEVAALRALLAECKPVIRADRATCEDELRKALPQDMRTNEATAIRADIAALTSLLDRITTALAAPREDK